MLPISDASSSSSQTRVFTSRTRSVPLSNPTEETGNSKAATLGYAGSLPSQRPPLFPMTGPLSSSTRRSSGYFGDLEEVNSSDNDELLKHAHRLRSGKLGMCNDPYCTTCPSNYNPKASRLPNPTVSASTFHNALYDDARSWARRFASSVNRCLPGIMNPHSKFVQIWTKFFAVSSLLAIFIDPLFFFIILVQKNNKCIVIDWPIATAFVIVRTLTDVIFFANMLLQFRLAYVARESTVVGAGQLVLVLSVIPAQLAISGTNYAKNLLRTGILVQYIPKLYRLLPLLAGQTPTGLIFESAWANFVINLLTFMLAGHVVGSCWYLFGLQRVNQCLRNACGHSGRECRGLIDCGHGNSNISASLRAIWRNSASANACFQEDGFSYGIYLKMVNLTTHTSLLTRYSYSLLWGFQVMVYSNNVWSLEMTLRRRDVEQWMSHRRLPEGIRKRVREAERFNWAATRGVNEELLFENMPDDLQGDIRRHLFIFLKKVRIFSLMDESILDSIRERLRQRTYISGSTVLHRWGPVEKIVFVVRGEMESTGEDGSVLPLSEGDVCGEELLTWCLERSAVNLDGRMLSKGLLSSRNVKCVTNVEAFSLSAADLEDVTSLFSRFLRSHRVQGAIRYESPYCRLRAATQIQVAWRYRKRRLQKLSTAQKKQYSSELIQKDMAKT
uniref:Cyclic nucleotide-binding domain-containing protein n=2 Tax=Brassica campestris TaxID=3711 RepID=M4EMD8_BRACM